MRAVSLVGWCRSAIINDGAGPARAAVAEFSTWLCPRAAFLPDADQHLLSAAQMHGFFVVADAGMESCKDVKTITYSLKY
jgi:hypothetical protein